MPIFKDYLTKEKNITDKVLSEVLDQKTAEATEADENFGLMMQRITDQVLRGGKRARPLLVRLGYKLGGEEMTDDVVKASLFPELIHQYLLVHDDIVDQDLMRYGSDTLEVVFGRWFGEVHGVNSKLQQHYGRSMAMLVGDHLRTLGYQLLHETDFDSDAKVEALTLMESVLSDTLLGWQIQYHLNFEDIDPEQEARFMRGLELVTSRYSFEAPLMVGVILAGKANEFGEGVREYSRHVGIAFQLMDDILGVFGELDKTGKPVGNDIREGKKTLLVLKAFEKADHEDQQFLKQVLGRDISESELERVQQIITDSGSLDANRKLANQHVKSAVGALKVMRSGDAVAIKKLEELAKFMVERDY